MGFFMTTDDQMFFFRKTTLPDGTAVTYEEAEEILLRRLEEAHAMQ